jgi:hypothetical protein
MLMPVRMGRALATTLVMLVACADAPGPGQDGPANGVPAGIPDVVEIVCEADGSTTVRTPQVIVQPDGIHVHLVSRLDEPASVNGFGFDIEKGETTHVTGRAPGVIQAACWPFSRHGSGEEPPTSTIEVLDPEGIYVSGEIECTGTRSGLIADFFKEPLDAGPVPLDVARGEIRGLRPEDEVVHLGYPERRDRAVAVARDGAIVATFNFVTFDGERWHVASNEICSSAELR